ncbi:hypothetical protein ACQ27_gp605 [Klebsiella phage K64-1]|nr:hypothetical protein ACQ27_gp605 [Klebsiella phage K64-1]
MIIIEGEHLIPFFSFVKIEIQIEK